MSVCDLETVDAIGINDDGSVLRLMLSDHLDWEAEEIHLETLQDKINFYLEYITTKGYKEKFNKDFESYIIEIYFKDKITKNCFKFLEKISKQLQEYKISINMHFEAE